MYFKAGLKEIQFERTRRNAVRTEPRHGTARQAPGFVSYVFYSFVPSALTLTLDSRGPSVINFLREICIIILRCWLLRHSPSGISSQMDVVGNGASKGSSVARPSPTCSGLKRLPCGHCGLVHGFVGCYSSIFLVPETIPSSRQD